MKLPTLEEFDIMCSKHDWYYMWSDDHKVWSNGVASATLIQALVEDGGEEYNEIYRKYLKENGNVGKGE